MFYLLNLKKKTLRFLLLCLNLLALSRSMDAMQHLVIKAGNSHLVAAIFEGDQITDKLRLDYDSGFELLLAKWIQKHPATEKALLGSVNSKVNKQIQKTLEFSSIPYTSHIPIDRLPIKLSVERSEKVGADLIANACAATELYPNRNIIIIDMGTAVTVSAVSKEHHFLGVSIMPGIEMSAKSLHLMTDKLPNVSVSKPDRCLGKNTAECIQSGLYFGLLGAIENIATIMAKEAFPEEEILFLATGGVTADHDDISGYVPKSDVGYYLQQDIQNYFPGIAIVHDLTLIGLHEILKGE